MNFLKEKLIEKKLPTQRTISFESIHKYKQRLIFDLKKMIDDFLIYKLDDNIQFKSIIYSINGKLVYDINKLDINLPITIKNIDMDVYIGSLSMNDNEWIKLLSYITKSNSI